MDKSHIHSADAIRGLACLAVLFSHAALTFFPALHGLPELSRNLDNIRTTTIIFNSPITFFYSGGAAVYVFFVLSGIVLSKSYDRTFVKIKTIPQQIIKRYIRLMIPCLASVLLSYVILTNTSIDTSLVSIWMDKFGKDSYSLSSALYDGVLGVFFDSGFNKYNWVLWTMRIELIGSIVLLVLYATPKNHRIIYKTLLLIIFILSSIFSDASPISLGILMFIIGSLMTDVKIKTGKSLSATILIVGLYLSGYHYDSHSYVLLSNLSPSYFKYSYQNIIYSISGVAICYSLVSYNWSWISKDHGTLKNIGSLSFSLYLTHLIVIYSVGVPSFNLMSSLGYNHMQSAVASILISMLTTFSLSLFFHAIFDHGAIILSKRVISNQRNKG